MPINEAALTALGARLARQDEAQRQRSLAQAEAGIDTSIDPGPERMPDRWDIGGRGRPRWSTGWEIGREPSEELGSRVSRGQRVTPKGIDLTQTLPPREAAFVPILGAEYPEGGRFTPGPMMTALIRAGQFPGRRGEMEFRGKPTLAQLWSQPRKLPPYSKSEVTQDLVNELSERVEADRQKYREEDRRRFIRDQERRIQEQREGVRAQEAAREMSLTRQFGTPTDRAENILALEALRMAE